MFVAAQKDIRPRFSASPMRDATDAQMRVHAHLIAFSSLRLFPVRSNIKFQLDTA
jgi:hypothetical protein